MERFISSAAVRHIFVPILLVFLLVQSWLLYTSTTQTGEAIKVARDWQAIVGQQDVVIAKWKANSDQFEKIANDALYVCRKRGT